MNENRLDPTRLNKIEESYFKDLVFSTINAANFAFDDILKRESITIEELKVIFTALRVFFSSIKSFKRK